MQFWLSMSSGDRLQLPVNPESYEVSMDVNHNDSEVVNLGEVTQMGNAGLKSISLSSFFPRDYDSGFCEYLKIPKPIDAVRKIEHWAKTKRPILVSITGTNVYFKASIRNFTYSEKGGEVGDIYYTIELKEYRAPKIRKYDPTKKVTKPVDPKRPTPEIPGGKYTVKKGDTLSSIAYKFYHDSSKWNVIYNANKSKIGSNPNRIYVGMVLSIPGTKDVKKPADDDDTVSSYQYFTIRSGDTLYEIAKAYGLTVSRVQLLNPSLKATSLQVGSKVKLPGDAKKLYDPRRLSYSAPVAKTSVNTASTETTLTKTDYNGSKSLAMFSSTERESAASNSNTFPSWFPGK
jgi:nucleoid-associated protein YgaU